MFLQMMTCVLSSLESLVLELIFYHAFFFIECNFIVVSF